MRAYADSSLNSRPGNKRTHISLEESPGLNRSYMSSSIDLSHMEDKDMLRLGGNLDVSAYKNKKAERDLASIQKDNLKPTNASPHLRASQTHADVGKRWTY